MNNKRLEDNLTTLLNLEYFGIHIEDVKDELDNLGLYSKTAYYYSVPESSTLEVDNNALNQRIKTAEDLKLLAKECLFGMSIKSCIEEYPDDEEFIKDVANNSSEYFKFYAKVRSGEIWTKELGNNRLKELRSEIKKASGYKEV